jgi:hypothetical protein
MSEGPSAGQIVGGIFLILFGLCIILVGGGCTLLWLGEIGGPGNGETLFNPLFLVSLVTLGAGIVTLWVGVKFLLGKYRN